MTKETLSQMAAQFVTDSTENRVSSEKAMRPEIVGMQMFDPPILGYASFEDDYLLSLPQKPEANLNQAPPAFWLETAQTVISFFLPFTGRVRESNRLDRNRPSVEYMHARVDGQAFLMKLCHYLKETLEEAGYVAVIPAADSRFWSAQKSPKNGYSWSSNWSERHVAYACGLGTFSLSRGIITRLGMSGRVGSLVTNLPLPPTPRPYQELEEYCTRCGACIVACPAQSITLKGGKDHPSCSAFLEGIMEEYRPYYGCGKCQAAVPCESRIPRPHKEA